MKAIRLTGLLSKEMLAEQQKRRLAWERQLEHERKHAPLEIMRDGSLRELPPDSEKRSESAMQAEAIRPPGPAAPQLVLARLEPPKLLRPDDVLVRVLCVGLDGTDRELMTGKDDAVPPAGETALTLGHESLGVVHEAGPESGFLKGDLVCLLIRRPCSDPGCVSCRNGQPDYCETGDYTERGIKGRDGYLAEYVVEQAGSLVRVPFHCIDFGVLAGTQSLVEKVWEQVQRIQQRLVWQPKTVLVLGLGPLALLAALTFRSMGLDTVVWSAEPQDCLAAELVRDSGADYERAESSAVGSGDEPKSAETSTLSGFLKETGRRADLIFECTGLPQVAFEAMAALAPGGVLALLADAPSKRSLKLDSSMLPVELPLENKCILGGIQAASRKNFETGLYRLEQMEELFPGVLERLLSERFTMEEVLRLDFNRIEIKAVVDLIPRSEWEGFLEENLEQVEYSFSV